jgi:RNA recognition motif-containing protein
MTAAEAPPSETLYVNNLNERVEKEELRRTLYALFSQFGAVLDVVALRTLRMRGQAHIVFAERGAAAKAKAQMGDFPLFDKPMRIQFARSKSDAVARLEGTLSQAELKERKRVQARLTAEAEARVAAGGKVGEDTRLDARKRRAESGPEDAEEGPSDAKRARMEPRLLRPQNNPPHNILLVENLPDDTTEDALRALFQDSPGFAQVRLTRVKGRVISFIDFDNADNAGEALKLRQHHVLSPEFAVVVSFAKQ